MTQIRKYSKGKHKIIIYQQKKYRLGTVSKKITGGLKLVSRYQVTLNSDVGLVSHERSLTYPRLFFYPPKTYVIKDIHKIDNGYVLFSKCLFQVTVYLANTHYTAFVLMQNFNYDPNFGIMYLFFITLRKLLMNVR